VADRPRAPRNPQVKADYADNKRDCGFGFETIPATRESIHFCYQAKANSLKTNYIPG